jgi:hypothetical protein
MDFESDKNQTPDKGRTLDIGAPLTPAPLGRDQRLDICP